MLSPNAQVTENLNQGGLNVTLVFFAVLIILYVRYKADVQLSFTLPGYVGWCRVGHFSNIFISYCVLMLPNVC